MRPLSPEEGELWARVTATIRPLSREKIEPQETGKQKPAATTRPAPIFRRAAPVPPLARPKPGTTLDSTWDRKLRTGAVEPERIVDLHGMTLDKAWRANDRGRDTAGATAAGLRSALWVQPGVRKAGGAVTDLRDLVRLLDA